MKLKKIILGVFIAVAASAALAQTNTPATDSAAPATNDVSAATNAALSPSAQTYLNDKAAEAAAVSAASNAAVATAVTTNAPAVVVATATVPADSGAAPATAVAVAVAPVTNTTAADTVVHDPSAVIPLIVMDEVPLTDAIKNLARQAGLNYMLDPKINYGAPGPDGVVHPQPTVSLRWENLTADQALNAVLENYNMVIIDDPKTHIARITIKDPAAPDPLITKIIQLKYADASNIVTSVETVFQDKRSKVLPDIRTSQLVVVATDREITAVDQLVARLDTPTKEVLIEAKLVELSKNPTTSKGIDWSGTAQAQHVSAGNNVTGGASGYPYTATIGQTSVLGPGPNNSVVTNFVNLLTYTPNNLVQSPGLLADTAHGFDPATLFLNADGVNAVMSFLNAEADAKVLSTPRAVTLDNEEATLSVTTAEPIFNTTAGTQGSPGGSTVLYTNLGTILKVTPRISANNTISLKVIPEVSDISGIVTKTVSGLENQADSFDVRRIETRVVIPSGNTLVMGGLVNDSVTKNTTKVPFFGDIPGLGWAFRSESKAQNKRNLIIFITPTIIANEDFQPTESTFLKTKVPSHKTPDFGAWDSGDPQDWSKLFHGKKKAADSENDENTADLPTTN